MYSPMETLATPQLSRASALDASGLQRPSVVGARVRAAAIGVMDETRRGAAPRERHVQRREGEMAVNVPTGCPAHHSPREEIENHREIPLGSNSGGLRRLLAVVAGYEAARRLRSDEAQRS
jgi:hypothetical protein